MAKKQSYLKKKKSFSGAQVLLFTLAFAVVGAVAVWQSLAAPHSGSGGGGKKGSYSGTISGPVLVTDVNTDGLANVNDTITFKVSSTAPSPYVDLKCQQSGTVVYQGQQGFFPAYPWGQNFTLSSGAWTSGAADCTAVLYYTNGAGTTRTDMATMNFHVNA